MKRFILAIGMNLLIPGTGLILLGQLWLGLALAVWFALGAEVTAGGILIAPATIPIVVTAVSAVSTGAAWLLAQGLLVARIRFLGDPNLPAELAILRQLAEEALSRSDYKAARSALLIARSIDTYDLPTSILWARLLTVTSSPSRARRAWLEVRRLDANQDFYSEIQEALNQLRTV